jgi:uncharacterized membrane protein YbhN (UPF0104 family)
VTNEAARRALRAGLGAIVSVALLWLVVRSANADPAEARRLLSALRPGWALLSLALIAGGYLANFSLWHVILRALGEAIPLRQDYRIWMLSQLGKYVPGKIWAALGRLVLLSRAGVPSSRSVVGMTYEIVLLILSGLLLSAATLPAWSPAARAAVPIHVASAAALAGLALAGLAALGLPWSRNLVSLLLGRFDPAMGAGAARSLGPLRLLGLAAGYGLSWALMGAGFAALLLAIHPVPALPLAGAAGAFVFSWVAGLVVFLAPAGLGVREGVLLLTLTPVVPGDVALLVVAGARVWTTAVELMAAGVALVVRQPGGTRAGADRSGGSRAMRAGRA